MRWLPRRKRGNRLERLLAQSALEDAMARARVSREPVRAYTKSGRVSHLLGPDGYALCPNMSAWGGSVWLGASVDSSDEEKQRAAGLPACHACERAAGKAAS